MKHFYFYQASLSENKANFMICYYSGRDLCFETFCNEVLTHFNSSIFTRNLVFVTPAFNKSDIESKLFNSAAQSIIKDRINSLQELEFHTCFINRNGKFELQTFNESNPILTMQEIEKILEIGLFNIIIHRNLIIEAHSNIHFVKPSGKHTTKFIDVKNILESSPEISFIATNLLKLLPEKVEKIYIDTSGIYSLAFELSNLIKTFDANIKVISIDSFSSYGGFEQYNFKSDIGTVVLISASTSNQLYKTLRGLVSLEQASFVTVIMTQQNCESQKVLVEFEKYRLNHSAKYFENFDSYSEDKCPMCMEQSSIPVVLDKSRFDFAAPRTESYLPVKMDSDVNLRNLMSKYKDLDAFRCIFDGVDGTKTPTPEYFIDVSKILQSDAFKVQIKKFINRFFPLNTSCIIHCKDQGAKELATLIQTSVSDLGLNIDLYNGDIDTGTEIEKGIVVVAGSLESGKSLLNISRALRKYHGQPITYIIGFAKYNSEMEFEKLKKDLRFSAGASGHHEVHVIEKILLPINEHKESSWDKEIELLLNLSPQYEDDNVLKEAIDARIQLLRNASSLETKGLGESLFNSTQTVHPLILGKSFAFWNDSDTNQECSHQATVYFTISSILQRLRTVNKNGIKPLGDGYIIRQLDPLLFDRFNEGIIQASVLRSSKSRELDYSGNDAQSRIIGSLIERMLKLPNSAESSGLSEFLLALCLKKLQIKRDHLSNFDELVLNLDKGTHPMAWIFANYAKTLLLGNISEDSISEDFVKF
ncbi:hypothetical protein FY048_13035 [Acinetobacter sp. 1124_18A]|uniref:hypothetical protein n=1 Tax=Acinetobacter sp. 1124_18A TaxID=2605958 RepID=UPI004059B10D